MEKLLELEDITLIPSTTNKGWLGNKINYLVRDAQEVTGIADSLPIFTSPMESVVGIGNWKIYQDSGIKPVLPRTEDVVTRLDACCYIFSAFSAGEVKTYFIDQDRRGIQSQFHVCIDAGNGHEVGIINLGMKLKEKYGNQIILMGGNIANPETYLTYSKFGFDYVRVGISSGSTVDKNFYGFHYPSASLLEAIKMVKSKMLGRGSNQPKIILDGGIHCHSDILKAIALGADYVMIGREFVRLVEASGTLWKKMEGNKGGVEEVPGPEQYYGMAGYELSDLGLLRQYSGNTTPEMQALRAGYKNVPDWKKGSPKVRVSDSEWSWVKVESSLPCWIQELKECIEYGFMMSDAASWEEFVKNVKYGRQH